MAGCWGSQGLAVAFEVESTEGVEACALAV